MDRMVDVEFSANWKSESNVGQRISLAMSISTEWKSRWFHCERQSENWTDRSWKLFISSLIRSHPDSSSNLLGRKSKISLKCWWKEWIFHVKENEMNLQWSLVWEAEEMLNKIFMLEIIALWRHGWSSNELSRFHWQISEENVWYLTENCSVLMLFVITSNIAHILLKEWRNNDENHSEENSFSIEFRRIEWLISISSSERSVVECCFCSNHSSLIWLDQWKFSGMFWMVWDENLRMKFSFESFRSNRICKDMIEMEDLVLQDENNPTLSSWK